MKTYNDNEIKCLAIEIARLWSIQKLRNTPPDNCVKNICGILGQDVKNLVYACIKEVDPNCNMDGF